MTLRVVFDTSTVISALILKSSRLAWLRFHWRERGCVPLISAATATELVKVLAYPKFRISQDERDEVLADYLPYCEIVVLGRKSPLTCRDPKDQAFLDLAFAGKADVLATGDRDLLILRGTTASAIETPEAYRLRTQHN